MSKFRFEEIAINSTEKKKPVESDKYTYLGLEHLDPGTLKVSRFGSDVAPIGEKLVMKKGDVLFGKRRAYQKKVAIAPFDGIFSAHGMVLRPKTEVIDSEFFPLFISSDYFLDAAIKISVGSLSPTINWKDLKNLEFELPDLETQRQLAKVLWALIDTIENYKILMTKTDELVKSQFIELFKDCLNQKPLTEICSPKQWKTIGTKDFTSEGYPVYGANGLIGKYKEFNHDKPTVMIGCRGTCGVIHVSEGKSYINGNAMCLDDPIPEINYKYLSAALKCYDFSKIITGTSQPQITIEGLKKVLVKIPTLEEQKAFISLSEQNDKSKFELENCIKNAVSMYKKILKEYLG
jgi:restriction endonuclease, S subunit